MPRFPTIADGWIANKEGTDLAQNIPFEKLGVKTYGDLGTVVLVHRWWSPPSSAIRGILNYYQVPQERLIMDMPGKRMVKESCYKKVPQLIIKPDGGGYQVNDSVTIIKHMYKVFTGNELSEEVGSDDELKNLVGRLPLALINDVHKRKGGSSMFAKHFAGSEGWNPVLKIIILNIVSGRFKKLAKEYPETFQDKMRWFMEQIRERNKTKSTDSAFWSCRDEPDPVDLCIYGYIVATTSMYGEDPEEETWVIEEVKAAGAGKWYTAVHQAYTARAAEPVIPEEARRCASQTVYGCW